MSKFILLSMLFVSGVAFADVTISDEEYLNPIIESTKQAQIDVAQLQQAINERIVILDANKKKIEDFLSNKPQVESIIVEEVPVFVDETIYPNLNSNSNINW